MKSSNIDKADFRAYNSTVLNWKLVLPWRISFVGSWLAWQQGSVKEPQYSRPDNSSEILIPYIPISENPILTAKLNMNYAKGFLHSVPLFICQNSPVNNKWLSTFYRWGNQESETVAVSINFSIKNELHCKNKLVNMFSFQKILPSMRIRTSTQVITVQSRI